MPRFKFRTWGWYLVLINRKNFKIKILRFKKNQACSMQMHKKRKELWCFLSGAGYFRMPTHMNDCGAHDAEYVAGNSVYVDVMRWHQFYAIKNTYVLEIQHGELCSEEDILRA